MPEFNEVIVHKPVFFSGGGLFAFSSTVNPTVSTNDPGNYAIHGDLSRRGVAYTQKDFIGSFGVSIVYLSRQRFFVSGGPDTNEQFSAEFNLATPALVSGRKTYHVIDGIFWILGDNGTSPLIYAKADGTGLTVSSGWVDRSGDTGVIFGSSFFMRKASTAGFLYYITQNLGGGGSPYSIMRGVASTAPGVAFTNVTTVPGTPGSQSDVVAYDVSSDGTTHIFANDLGNTYRSQDGGNSFALISPGINPNEIVYSPFYNRWVMCSSSGTVRYSDSNGIAWSVPTRIDTNPKNSGSFQAFATAYHIEKIDPDGRYLIMVSSYAPIRIHISEDGGGTWTFLQQMMSPSYDITQIPRSGATTTAQLALVRTATELLLYQGGTFNTDEPYNWNFDNAMFTSGPMSFPI
jgi:hypothetical protein